jgi:DNA (cytosine-5)-methyltransferase 1
MWFAGSRSSQYTQVGDAVPPMLGHALGSALRRQLEGAAICPTTHYQPEATSPLLVAA